MEIQARTSLLSDIPVSHPIQHKAQIVMMYIKKMMLANMGYQLKTLMDTSLMILNIPVSLN